MENLALMQRIDELHTAHPFCGSRKMAAVLKREGHGVNRKRVQRLMGTSNNPRLAVNPVR